MEGFLGILGLVAGALIPSAVNMVLKQEAMQARVDEQNYLPKLVGGFNM